MSPDPSAQPAASDFVVVFVTAPDPDTAASLARALVGEKLAACVNIVPGLRSIYTWQGNLCDEQEVLCVVKTLRELFPALCARVTSLHPYQVPEIIALPIVDGHAPYLAWLRGETRAP
jgi:periplasmic divalent cation tolerance protein